MKLLLESICVCRETIYVGNHDACEWAQEDRVSIHEGQETLRTGDDLPRHERPAADDHAQDLSAPDVDILREQRGHVVGCGERVGGDIGPERSKCESSRGEERRRTVVPVVDEGQWVPENFVIQHGAR